MQRLELCQCHPPQLCVLDRLRAALCDRAVVRDQLNLEIRVVVHTGPYRVSDADHDLELLEQLQ